MDTHEAIFNITHTCALDDFTGQPFDFDTIGVAGGIHLIVEAEVGRILVFNVTGMASITPEDRDRMADNAIAILVQHFYINVVFAAGLLFIPELSFDHPPVRLSGFDLSVLDVNTQLIQSAVPNPGWSACRLNLWLGGRFFHNWGRRPVQQ